MRTVIVGGLVAALLSVTAVAAHAYIGSPTYQQQILDRTNAVRADNGRVALKLQTCLDTYANSWAKYLATQKKSLQHRPSSQLTTIMKRCNLDGVGENLARYYPSGTATVNAWKNSSGHHRNQIGAGHRYIGIGAYRDADDRYYAVALYGNPR